MKVKEFLTKCVYNEFKVKQTEDGRIFEQILCKDEVKQKYGDTILHKIGYEFFITQQNQKDMCVIYV